MNADTVAPDDLVERLLPCLNAKLAAEFRAVRDLMALFPGQSLAEVTKGVRSLLASSRVSVPALTDRAKALAAGGNTETLEVFVKDLGKLTAAEIKAVGLGVGLELTGSAKAPLVAEIRTWVQSGGSYRPATAAERSEQKVKQFVGDLLGRLHPVTPEVADEAIQLAETAKGDRKFSKDEFEILGQLLTGGHVKGTKAQVFKVIQNHFNQLAISHGQLETIAGMAGS
jgi:hypothetical protein